MAARPRAARDDVLSSRPFTVLVLAATMSAAGCHGMILSSVQRERLREAQAFADRTTAAYQVAAVNVVPSIRLRTIYDPSDRSISVDPRSLDDRDWLLSLAHELGHVTLAHRHERIRDVTELRHMELDANARAIEILVRVRGWSEDDAVRRLAGYFVAANDKIRSGTRRLASGHLPPCHELDDLLERFPAVRDAPACPRR